MNAKDSLAWTRRFRAIIGDRSGAILVMMGLLLPTFIVVAAMSVEIGRDYVMRADLQSAADAAALAGASQLSNSDTTTVFAAADTFALRNMPTATYGTVLKSADVQRGFWSTQKDSFFTTADSGINAVRVTTRLSSTNSNSLGLMFGKVAHISSSNVTAHAVAVPGGSTGTGCVLGLGGTGSAVSLSNNATLTGSCGVYSNSSLACGNNSQINGPAIVVGTDPGCNVKGKNTTHASAASDPYSGVSASPGGSCSGSKSVGNNGSLTIGPGHYCSISVANNGTLTMTTGTYYVDTQFSFSNNAVLNANPLNGVTIILTGNFALSFGNNVIVNLTAQSSGTFAGIALMGPRNGTAAVVQDFSNNVTVNLQGAIYFPSQTVTFDNNLTIDAPNCGEVIADVINLSNNAGFQTSKCAADGVTLIGSSAGSKLHLVQ
jgi:Flp pilus assembly protein TadG